MPSEKIPMVKVGMTEWFYETVWPILETKSQLTYDYSDQQEYVRYHNKSPYFNRNKDN